MYKARYQQILANRPPDEGGLLRGDRHRSVRHRYYDYIAAQLEDVTRKLATLSAS